MSDREKSEASAASERSRAGEGRRIVEELLGLLAGGGARGYLGEPVSQLEHALQTAHFARAAGASDALVVAALLHDVGHLCDAGRSSDVESPSEVGVSRLEPGEPTTELGVIRHDSVGAAYLRAVGIDAAIVALVEGHVRAKRYLVARRAAYRDRLSAASVRTLVLQGGPLSPEEAAAFEREPLFGSLVRLRQWDEMGKVPGLRVAPLDAYLDLLRLAIA